MSHRILVVSGKGGTGKTTTALNLSVAFAERGCKTLLVDLDPQGGVGLALAKEDTEWAGLAELLLEKATLSQALFQTNLKNLAILPRGRLDPINVAQYESLLASKKTLGQVLDQLDGEVDYILLDAPSGLGQVTRAALAQTHFALVPLQAEPMALRAVKQVLRVVDHVHERENPALRLLGLVPTMVELSKDVSFAVMGRVWSDLAGVMETHIPRSDEFSVASDKGIPVAFLGGSLPPEARRFDLLVDEIEKRIAQMRPQTEQLDDRPERSLV